MPALTSVFGLPAHPLIVHVPVVLVPLSFLTALGALLRPRWRRTLAGVTAALAVVSLVAVQLAIDSGEDLRDSLERSELIEDHAGQGDTLLPVVAVLAAAGVAALVAVRRGWSRAATGLAALVVVAALVAGGFTARVGHSGAKATWEDDPRTVQPADGGGVSRP